MAQSASPDYDQYTEDPSLSDESGEGGKSSFLSKLKDKTKHHGKRLKSKLKPGSDSSAEGTGGTNDDEDEEEEEDAPVHNAVSGETQPGYEPPSSDQKPSEGSVAEPKQSFPGNFAGVQDDETQSGKGDEEGLTKSFQGLSTNDESAPESATPEPESTNEADSNKPLTEKATDNLSSAKDQTKDTVLGGAGAAGVGAAGSEEQTGSADAPPVTEQAGQQAQQVGDKASETGKSWSQWAAEKVGYAKDSAAANAPTTADGKPVHEAAYASALGAKDTAVGKAGETKDAFAAHTDPSQIPSDPAQQSVVQKATVHTDPSQIPSDPAQQSYVQKATGGIYGAKDSFFAKTQPGEEHKALSQQVTETVGNLPATIKSSLGFGGKTGSSPSTTPTSSDAPVSSPTEEAPGAPPQSPGLVSRITGLFGQKKPATGNSTGTDTGAEPTSTS